MEITGFCGNAVIRCPRLGGETSFMYCVKESGNLPCHRIINCWHYILPVEKYLKDTMNPEQWELFSKQIPKDKISTLIDLVESTKKRTDHKKDRDGSFC